MIKTFVYRNLALIERTSIIFPFILSVFIILETLILLIFLEDFTEYTLYDIVYFFPDIGLILILCVPPFIKIFTAYRLFNFGLRSRNMSLAPVFKIYYNRTFLSSCISILLIIAVLGSVISLLMLKECDGGFGCLGFMIMIYFCLAINIFFGVVLVYINRFLLKKANCQ
jgi:hypothetical protein